MHEGLPVLFLGLMEGFDYQGKLSYKCSPRSFEERKQVANSRFPTVMPNGKPLTCILNECLHGSLHCGLSE